MARLVSELEELLDEELEEELLEGEVSETSSFSLLPDPLMSNFRFDFLSDSDDEPRSSTLAGMRGESSGIALIVLPWARKGTEVRHITGRVVSFAGISIGPLMAETPDITPIGPMAADDDEDDEDDEDDDDDDDDDDDELEMGGETLSNSLCSSSVIAWKVG